MMLPSSLATAVNDGLIRCDLRSAGQVPMQHPHATHPAQQTTNPGSETVPEIDESRPRSRRATLSRCTAR